MLDILKPKFGIPLEREYEGWIVEQIEQYFRAINKQVSIFAVSPKLEPQYPADEFVAINSKLVGLQFKRPHMSSKKGAIDFSNLHWKFNSKSGQFETIQSTPDIYYCLPTFINKDWKYLSLHHCLFWRPEQDGRVHKYRAWYDNYRKRIQTHYCCIKSALRWGLFYEKVIGCTIGRKINCPDDINIFIKILKNNAITQREIIEERNNDNRQRENEEKPEESKSKSLNYSGLYFLIINQK